MDLSDPSYMHAPLLMAGVNECRKWQVLLTIRKAKDRNLSHDSVMPNVDMELGTSEHIPSKEADLLHRCHRCIECRH